MAGAERMLRLVHEAEEARPLKLFCGHCAAGPGEGSAALTGSRVCAKCGLGLLLEASEDTAPTSADAFLVVDPGMSLRAVSRRAERLLGVPEPEAVDRHLSDFLCSADTDSRASQSFLALVLMAATGRNEAQTVAVRPSGEFGVRYWARVSTCGPKTAALLLIFNME